MKKHAIIPIFIPHEGCPNDCVFCNQKKITARTHAEDNVDIDSIAEKYLSTLNDPRPEVIEMAMYGGSFTGIPLEKQNEYLSVARRYKDNGLIDKIHLSTRPDYINEEILTNLKNFKVDVIELGVQSFDDEVLRLSERGHDSSIVYQSCKMIQDFGFTLGIQLMVGLPGDNLEKALYSAREAVKIGPEIARLYPTIVIEDTKLLSMYRDGSYKPLSLEEAIERTKEMYKILSDAGINIIRVGLKSSDIINENGDIYGTTFHPAFRQLVESRIAREILDHKVQILYDKKIKRLNAQTDADTTIIEAQESLRLKHNKSCEYDNSTGVSGCCGISSDEHLTLMFSANSRSFSNIIGMKRENIDYLKAKYPNLRFKFCRNEELKDYQYEIYTVDSGSDR